MSTEKEPMKPTDLTAVELQAIAKAIRLWERISDVLSVADLHPRDPMHISFHTVGDEYVGFIGWGSDGNVTFQPSAEGES